MALGAALSYSLSSVLYEKYVVDISQLQFAPTMSITALGLSILFSAMEWREIADLNFTVVVLLLVYGIGSVLFYTTAIYLIKQSSALYYNVSLLMTNVYSFVLSIILLDSSYNLIIVIPIIAVISGTVVYNAIQLPPPKDSVNNELSLCFHFNVFLFEYMVFAGKFANFEKFEKGRCSSAR